MGAGIVRDQVEVLTLRGGNAEGLLHETVGLVSITVRALLTVGSIIIGTVRGFVGPVGRRGGKGVSSPFTLHFAIGQEAAGDSACAPTLAVGPSPHASLSFVPYKDRA